MQNGSFDFKLQLLDFKSTFLRFSFCEPYSNNKGKKKKDRRNEKKSWRVSFGQPQSDNENATGTTAVSEITQRLRAHKREVMGC